MSSSVVLSNIKSLSSNGLYVRRIDFFECKLCGKHISHRSSLRNHTMIHTGEKPYKCDKCGKYFTKLSNLRVHERTHIRARNHTNAKAVVALLLPLLTLKAIIERIQEKGHTNATFVRKILPNYLAIKPTKKPIR